MGPPEASRGGVFHLFLNHCSESACARVGLWEIVRTVVSTFGQKGSTDESPTVNREFIGELGCAQNETAWDQWKLAPNDRF